MKFEIPFDEFVFREQMDLLFSAFAREQKEGKNKTKLFIILPTVFGLTIISLSLNGPGIIGGILCCMIGIFYAGWYGLFIYQFKKIKVKFLQQVDQEVKRKSQLTTPIIFDFTEDELSCEEEDLHVRMKWKLILSYKIINDHLFLIIDSEGSSGFAISKNQIGASEFEELVTFVSSKTVNKTEDQDVSVSSSKGNPELIDQ
ncbi:MAG: hypothetical protein ACI837_003259 [Crocinitomicaceae bacterium]|jgi:hypothetical protein